MSTTVPPWENADQLLPAGVAADFVGMIEETSLVLALGRTLRMSAVTESIPLIAFMPKAKFVSPAYGGRKPATEIKWTAVEIKAEEVAATVPVPNAWIMDAAFDVEGQVERSLATAVAHAIDQAIIFGQDAPASYPTGGILGFADQVTGADALSAVDAAMTDMEGKGVVPDGIAAGAKIGSALRQAYREANALPGERPAQVLYGVPVRQSLVFQGADVDAVIGGWQYLAIGIREDVTFGRSTDGVLLDDDGNIIASAFQDNVTLVKVYARIGCAIGQPSIAAPGELEPQKPFVAATWSTAPAGDGGGGNGSDGGVEPASQSASTRSRASKAA